MNLAINAKVEGKHAEEPYVNGIYVKLKDGRTIELDRDCTEYTFDDKTNTLFMVWKQVYVWDSEYSDLRSDDYEAFYLDNTPEMLQLFDGAEIKGADIEEDCPSKNYGLRITDAILTIFNKKFDIVADTKLACI